MELGKIVGIVHITKRDASGVILEETSHNTETNYALSAIAQWLAGIPNWGAIIPPSQIGAGNGSGTVSASDTSLWSPIAGTQRLCDSIEYTLGYYAQFSVTYGTSDPNGTYSELGLFDANGNMWAHVSINQYKDVGQTLTAQWMIYMQPDSTNGTITVTNYACSAVAQWLAGTPNATGGIAPPTTIQLGTGAGTPTPQDTAMWAPSTATNLSIQSYGVTSSNSTQFATTFSSSSDPGGPFTEVALWDDGGNMWVHGQMPSAAKYSNMNLAIAVTIGVAGDQ